MDPNNSEPIIERTANQDRLWDEEYAAQFLGKSVEFLRADRGGLKLIPHRIIGGAVAYAISDVIAYRNRVDKG